MKKKFKLKGFKYFPILAMDYIVGQNPISFEIDGEMVYFISRKKLLTSLNPLQNKVNVKLL